MSRVIGFLVLVAALMAAATVALPAAGATSCGRRVVDDWFDGRIDRTYKPHCYRDALRLLPPDARAYTNAAGDIERAMLAAVRSYGRPKSKAAKSGAATPKTRRLQSYRAPVRGDAPFKRAARVGSSEDAASVPLPIVVLAGVTGLVVLAAGTNRVARGIRLRGRTN
ncbi:MAG TPA: hypothetical protein VF101_07195 [Gaiellaceae bacterium]